MDLLYGEVLNYETNELLIFKTAAPENYEDAYKYSYTESYIGIDDNKDSVVITDNQSNKLHSKINYVNFILLIILALVLV